MSNLENVRHSLNVCAVQRKFSIINSLIFASVLMILPVNSWALSDEQSKHLLLRAGFGAQPELLQQVSKLAKSQAVTYLLNQQPSFAAAPSCVNNKLLDRKARRKLSADQRKAYRRSLGKCNREFRSWYLEQLIADKAVLANQMGLFWHNHFTSSLRKVKASKLMYGQHLSIEKYALGSFGKLLKAMVNDPAMLVYLDNVNNSKVKPNENLGRELLELFTLGEGHYSEADVLSAAKALTGLRLNSNYQSQVHNKLHDSSAKTIFAGTTIRSADDLVAALLAHPQTSLHISRAIWQHFISVVDERQVAKLAKVFARDWDIKQLVHSILDSDQFWQDSGKMIKSPVELVVGSVKTFQGIKIPAKRLTKMLSEMGQVLFDPPNVKGWPKDRDWLDTNKYIVRSYLMDQLARAISSNMAVSGAPYCSLKKMASLAAIALPDTQKSKQFDNSMDGSCQQQLTQLVTHPIWQLK
ncbi:MAG: hypothetical protein OFPI_03890 [Osedax symbiont Rs2]|nr:MAG: hypothetical protein OFPI_03890 [Osedax symbiont Rs2]